jgi:hypothetical protein
VVLRSQTASFLPIMTSFAGITYSEAPGTSAMELEILHSIVAREEYVIRLKQKCSQLRGKFNAEVSDILDLVRVASMQVVEAVVRWREQQVPLITCMVSYSLN